VQYISFLCFTVFSKHRPFVQSCPVWVIKTPCVLNHKSMITCSWQLIKTTKTCFSNLWLIILYHRFTTNENFQKGLIHCKVFGRLSTNFLHLILNYHAYELFQCFSMSQSPLKLKFHFFLKLLCADVLLVLVANNHIMCTAQDSCSTRWTHPRNLKLYAGWTTEMDLDC